MNTEHTMVTHQVLFLIDGNSQMYRAYHAIRELTGPDGRSTNAVYGFVAMLRKLVADQRPELIACAFDLAGPTFRSALAADYKANRPAMPDDLVEQIPYVHRSCEALGVPILPCVGFAAGQGRVESSDSGLSRSWMSSPSGGAGNWAGLKTYVTFFAAWIFPARRRSRPLRPSAYFVSDISR